LKSVTEHHHPTQSAVAGLSPIRSSRAVKWPTSCLSAAPIASAAPPPNRSFRPGRGSRPTRPASRTTRTWCCPPSRSNGRTSSSSWRRPTATSWIGNSDPAWTASGSSASTFPTTMNSWTRPDPRKPRGPLPVPPLAGGSNFEGRRGTGL